MGLIDYIKDTRGELKHVSWPTKKQSIIFTTVVILVSLSVAFYLGLLDSIFTIGIERVVL